MLVRERLLELALKGLEAEQTRIDSEIRDLRSQLGGTGGTMASTAGGRRRMSAAAKQKISQAMKRRYAAMRSAIQASETKKPRPGGLTAAGRKKLSDMMKARWAARRRAAAKR